MNTDLFCGIGRMGMLDADFDLKSLQSLHSVISAHSPIARGVWELPQQALGTFQRQRGRTAIWYCIVITEPIRTCPHRCNYDSFGDVISFVSFRFISCLHGGLVQRQLRLTFLLYFLTNVCAWCALKCVAGVGAYALPLWVRFLFAESSRAKPAVGVSVLAEGPASWLRGRVRSGGFWEGLEGLERVAILTNLDLLEDETINTLVCTWSHANTSLQEIAWTFHVKWEVFTCFGSAFVNYHTKSKQVAQECTEHFNTFHIVAPFTFPGRSSYRRMTARGILSAICYRPALTTAYECLWFILPVTSQYWPVQLPLLETLRTLMQLSAEVVLVDCSAGPPSEF